VNTERPRLRLPVVAGIVLLTVAVDAVTWYAFVLICGIGENFTGPFVALCGRNRPQPQVHLPALGALLCITGAIIAWRRRSYPILVAAGAFGILAAIGLWALYGDPAGNFHGILG
jgi:hypothetical protein